VIFDRIAVLDWSAAKGPKQGKDSIWLGVCDGRSTTSVNPPTRAAAEAALADLCARPGSTLLGADFSFGFPAGFAAALTGQPRALAVWDWLAARVGDDDRNTTNYREAAAEANASFPGDGPFWGNGAAEVPGLPRLKPTLPPGLAAHRAVERAARAQGLNPKSVWQLAGAGAVGAQGLTGLPVLARLRAAYGAAVWPFEPWHGSRLVFAEVYPATLKIKVGKDEVPDDVQVRRLAEWLWDKMTTGDLAALMATPEEPEEGWILGIPPGPETRTLLPAPLSRAPLTPPRLRNDCFAMPQGVDWVPVDDALARLRAVLHPVTGTEVLPTAAAGGRILAEAARALRANPPAPNAAVDGYGFAHASLAGEGPHTLPLVPGRAAAGAPLPGAVPSGQAVRILTGALLPEGVDTVVLDEDCATDGARVAFDGPVKPRSNTRRAGEDVAIGAELLSAGRSLTPADLALLSATGVAEVTVRRRLRVAVLSTGDEIAPLPDPDLAPHRTIDANRPMLLEIIRRWGHEAIDLGHAPDRTAAVRRALDRGAARADAILTSGGASAGDEDHVSRLLAASGTLAAWRIALKPGRPLALALWGGVPVFGLPGNPVAALVCTLIFARPALAALAGAPWPAPLAITVPAAFTKSKKPGRREYLRARLTADGAAEVYRSEGSGRIAGLSWAEGLVELPDGATDVTPGTPVRYLPFAGFGMT
jgi:molybdopterin molybdotransferase